MHGDSRLAVTHGAEPGKPRPTKRIARRSPLVVLQRQVARTGAVRNDAALLAVLMVTDAAARRDVIRRILVHSVDGDGFGPDQARAERPEPYVTNDLRPL